MKKFAFFAAFIFLFFQAHPVVADEVLDEIKDIKKELRGLKGDIEEIKKLLKSRPTPPARKAVKTRTEASMDDDAVLGKKDAPVTIIEFSDYQCPYCKRAATQTFPKIKEEFVEQGKVKYVFRDFPLEFHKDAGKASEAAECAGDQGKYWEMHDKIFENQRSLKVPDLKGYAKDIGLKTSKFDKCLDSNKYTEEVALDLEAGKAAGVAATPSFIVGRSSPDGKIKGLLIRGAQPYQVFKSAIEQLLKEGK